MKITIITATYNVEGSLSMTLNSISEQTFRDYEVIIIDGDSRDNTIGVAQSYINKIVKISIFSEPDAGVYDAMNKGIKLAKGDYIYFLNAGDILFDKNVLSNVACYLDGDTLVYGNAYSLDSNGKITPYRIGEFNKYRLAHTNICHQTIFYPRLYIEKHLFDLKYKLFADWETNMFFWNRCKHNFIDTSIAIYENGGMSVTQTDKLFKKDQVKLIYKHLGLDSILYLTLRRILSWKL